MGAQHGGTPAPRQRPEEPHPPSIEAGLAKALAAHKTTCASNGASTPSQHDDTATVVQSTASANSRKQVNVSPDQRLFFFQRERMKGRHQVGQRGPSRMPGSGEPVVTTSGSGGMLSPRGRRPWLRCKQTWRSTVATKLPPRDFGGAQALTVLCCLRGRPGVEQSRQTIFLRPLQPEQPSGLCPLDRGAQGTSFLSSA